MFEGLGIFSSLITVDNYLVPTTWNVLIGCMCLSPPHYHYGVGGILT